MSRELKSTQSTTGFTLIEVALALAIVATVFVALLGLLPAGLNASRDAANSTVVSVILESLHNRLQNQTLRPGYADFSPAYFDIHGAFIPSDADEKDRARRIYRADVRIGDWHRRPEGTSALQPVTFEVSWPIDAKSGERGPGNPKTTVTYTATALTGTDWPSIDSAYQPKIEF